VRRTALFGAALALIAGAAAAAPRSAGIKDPDTRAWFQIAEALAGDDMEGRDIGSPGYDRAAQVVADRFKAAGLKPAGDNGGWFQVFPVHEAKVEAADLTLGAGARRLHFLQDFSVRAADDLPAKAEGPVMWAGFCRPADLAQARGKWVVCVASRRKGMTISAERIANARAAGAAGLVQMDDPFFTIEPARWPAAYARTVTIADKPPASTGGFPVLTASVEAAQAMLGDTRPLLSAKGREAASAFETTARMTATFKVSTRDYTAKNVLGVLPGSDPTLKAEHLVLSAHLDGYGYGEPVKGDSLYNGALDDAAYVGTLIRFADKHRGKPLRRSIVLAAFTGEEKGLLGAHWFVDHPTVPKASMVADINLDQLRPLFPLKLLTQLAVDTTTLGTTAKAVASSMGIRIQADPEPERSLFTRADHYPFMQAGIPGTGFIFGYEPGTEAERRYREWYEVRYHRPQDDLTQPMDFQAAGDFNRFFYKLAETVADADKAPSWTGPKP
jgi:Zn-dependent M28 family amino/carboxypeptidase